MALSSQTSNRPQNPHVLVVDDDKPVAELFKVELEKLGYDVDIAQDGVLGLQKARQLKPKLIILDMIMPKLGGLEFLQKLRNEKSTFAIPVMVVSHLESGVEQKKCEELGIECFMVKHQHSVSEIINLAKKIINR